MKAIQFDKFGTPDVLKCVELPIPKISDKQILVEVRASGINPIDLKIRSGESFASPEIAKHFPSGLGFDFSGKVKAYGKLVQDVMVGDEILGSITRHAMPGAYAQYCVIEDYEWVLKPHQVSFVQAAALPIPGLTAHQALFEFGQLKAKQRVLILGAGGAVGQIAVQLAHNAGAHVIATGNSIQGKYLRTLGARKVFDVRKDGFTALEKPVDLIIDLIGGATANAALKTLKVSGRIVTVPTITADEIVALAKDKGLNACGMLMKMDQRGLTELAAALARNELHVNVTKVFSLADASEAHEYLEKNTGKVVLTTDFFGQDDV